MADFHFLRPLWLLLLLILPFLPVILRRARQGDSGWGHVIPEPLLRPLIRRSGSGPEHASSPLLSLVAATIILALALAGPSWREAPTPLQQQNDSLVIVLDLSLSMLATDSEPDRLTLAKRKIRDILKQREGSLTALVVYAADAHVVTPLTDDRKTIEGMLGVLEPVIMPATGNRADLGIAKGLELLQQGAPGKGHLLLIADQVHERYLDPIHTLMSGSRFPLSTLTVGTPEGGPIPLEKQGFIRDNGTIVIARATPERLASLASVHDGNSHRLTLDNSDIRALNLRPRDSGEWQDTESELTVNRWQDDGYWLLWVALPLLLIGWRRGGMAMLFLALLPLSPRPVMALEWDTLWQRPDQQAPELIQENPEAAAQRLESPEWRGAALYRARQYEEAAEAFSRADSPLADYNRGNALARAGKLQEAINAYDEALAARPEMEDARFNRELVQDLLEQQEQQEQQEQSDGGQDRSESDSGSSDNSRQPEGQSGQDGGEQESKQRQAGDGTEEPKQQNGQATQQQDSQEPPTGQQAGELEDSGAEDSNAGSPQELSPTPLTQGQEQWLRRIPDDPGGLLRRKFLQQYQQRNTESDEGDTPW